VWRYWHVASDYMVGIERWIQKGPYCLYWMALRTLSLSTTWNAFNSWLVTRVINLIWTIYCLVKIWLLALAFLATQNSMLSGWIRKGFICYLMCLIVLKNPLAFTAVCYIFNSIGSMFPCHVLFFLKSMDTKLSVISMQILVKCCHFFCIKTIIIQTVTANASANNNVKIAMWLFLIIFLYNVIWTGIFIWKIEKEISVNVKCDGEYFLACIWIGLFFTFLYS